MPSELTYLAAFDTETTGVNVLEDRIVTASIVYLDPVGNIIDNYEWLINPGVDIPDGAAAVHGITTEHAQEYGSHPATSLYEMSSILAYFLANGVPVVAYNASYDFSILDAEVRRHLEYENGFAEFFETKQIPKLIIDPYVIDKKMDPYRRGSRTLTVSSTHYGITLDNAHASFDDCLAAGGVAHAIWEKFPIMAEGDFDTLYDLQVQWYKTQQEGLADYFKKKGKEVDDINTQWPIRSADAS